ncbi:hypothetical protein JX265_012392 [Neoarthrinium moseri]|uniref:Major facilitator superfamily (MFS) profile domain-containing protein n=1 Tax=Neoarthrinium moseri TaxID=1658444 RepID=A0A9P9WAQ1_9PEZI|nr:uncharacterized protein JN550_011161 [Neoarthrinium moseri]KAI1851526.1 hypothetical protein JX266_002988 [Neoarthrinium moseri]KAI1855037.1 hypothetical protein JX265_012392 [Neoarthrinium moseri]KAI1860846.1 hypothetical protein JN550_011161 [Neoarthrinium moseri]
MAPASYHDDSKEAGAEALPAASDPPSEAPVLDSRPDYSIFTTWEKTSIVLGAAAGAFLSPLTGQIYLPALNLLAQDLKITDAQANLTVTTYMIFQGITPMFIGSFADGAGRRPAYLLCFVVYIAANIGCALSPNYVALLILRMLQSAGSSTTVALCQAVVSDIITSAERGQYVGYVTVPVLLAPAVGPVLGGAIAHYLGWRWIFWFLTILAGAITILYAMFMPETCRRIVDDGSVRPHPIYRTLWQLWKDALQKRKARRSEDASALQRTASRASVRQSLRLKRPNPLRSLTILFEVEMSILLFYSAIPFASFYAIATAMPSQLGENYGLDDLKVGLMYLPLGGGSMFAAIAMGRVINWNYRRHCKKLGVPFERSKQQDLSEFPIEKARLEVGIPLLSLSTVVLFAWGWALQYHAHLAVLCVLLFIMGVGIIGYSNTTGALIVDVNPSNAGAATASNNLTRCLIGAAATAVINPMIKGIGAGWAFFILGALQLVGAPVLLLVMRNGIQWRKAKEARRRQKKERKASRVANAETSQGQQADYPPDGKE